jgi:hypothetical protein
MGEKNYVEIMPETMKFQIHVETDVKVVYTQLQNVLKNYKNETRGATIVMIQSPIGILF